VIEATEIEEWARRFRVSSGQITRDHFISHVLHALGKLHTGTRFFGGTALCRTYLDPTRLSEDIDLLHPDPPEFLTTLRDELPRAVRREFPDASWSATVPERDGLASSLGSPNVDAIKIYVGRDGPNTAAWEFIETRVGLRYNDLPPDQTFECPTPPTFAAMKLAAWSDRHAPRDLFDLAGLAALGTLRDPNVERIYAAKMRLPIVMADFLRVPRPTAAAWETELAAQVGHLPPADACLGQVRDALAAVGESSEEPIGPGLGS
jgi:hypothetical protein